MRIVRIFRPDKTRKLASQKLWWQGVLSHHHRQPSLGQDKPLMNQSKQQLGTRLDDADIRNRQRIFFGFDVEDHFECFFPEGHLGLKACRAER